MLARLALNLLQAKFCDELQSKSTWSLQHTIWTSIDLCINAGLLPNGVKVIDDNQRSAWGM